MLPVYAKSTSLSASGTRPRSVEAFADCTVTLACDGESAVLAYDPI
jgi:hypothetical protein